MDTLRLSRHTSSAPAIFFEKIRPGVQARDIAMEPSAALDLVSADTLSQHSYRELQVLARTLGGIKLNSKRGALEAALRAALTMRAKLIPQVVPSAAGPQVGASNAAVVEASIDKLWASPADAAPAAAACWGPVQPVDVAAVHVVDNEWDDDVDDDPDGGDSGENCVPFASRSPRGVAVTRKGAIDWDRVRQSQAMPLTVSSCTYPRPNGPAPAVATVSMPPVRLTAAARARIEHTQKQKRARQ